MEGARGVGNWVASVKASQAFTLGGTVENTGPQGGDQDPAVGPAWFQTFPVPEQASPQAAA